MSEKFRDKVVADMGAKRMRMRSAVIRPEYEWSPSLKGFPPSPAAAELIDRITTGTAERHHFNAALAPDDADAAFASYTTGSVDALKPLERWLISEARVYIEVHVSADRASAHYHEPHDWDGMLVCGGDEARARLLGAIRLGSFLKELR